MDQIEAYGRGNRRRDDIFREAGEGIIPNYNIRKRVKGYFNQASDWLIPPAGSAEIPDAAINMIKNFEGLRLDPYYDVGYPTIGYGSRIGSKDEELYNFSSISSSTADSMLINKLEGFDDQLDGMVSAPINNNQRSALLSFIYNIGSNAFKNSTLRKRLNAMDYDAVSDQFLKWKYSDGEEVPGLLKRRKAEQDLFNTPVQVQSSQSWQSWLRDLFSPTEAHAAGPSIVRAGARGIKRFNSETGRIMAADPEFLSEVRSSRALHDHLQFGLDDTATIDSWFDRVSPTKKPFSIYRGGTYQLDSSVKPGSVIDLEVPESIRNETLGIWEGILPDATTRGQNPFYRYATASYDPRVAGRFSEGLEGFGSYADRPYRTSFFDIQVPTGSRVIPLPNYMNQYEALMPRGSQFEVMDKLEMMVKGRPVDTYLMKMLGLGGVGAFGAGVSILGGTDEAEAAPFSLYKHIGKRVAAGTDMHRGLDYYDLMSNRYKHLGSSAPDPIPHSQLERLFSYKTAPDILEDSPFIGKFPSREFGLRRLYRGFDTGSGFEDGLSILSIGDEFTPKRPYYTTSSIDIADKFVEHGG